MNMGTNYDQNTSSPDSAKSDIRDARGRFGKGNKANRGGNPLNSRVQKIRAALLRAVKPSDVTAAIKQLVAQARGGDRFALELILDRTVGRPSQVELLERIERLEQKLAQQQEAHYERRTLAIGAA
jgi:hypothetical protein